MEKIGELNGRPIVVDTNIANTLTKSQIGAVIEGGNLILKERKDDGSISSEAFTGGIIPDKILASINLNNFVFFDFDDYDETYEDLLKDIIIETRTTLTKDEIEIDWSSSEINLPNNIANLSILMSDLSSFISTLSLPISCAYIEKFAVKPAETFTLYFDHGEETADFIGVPFSKLIANSTKEEFLKAYKESTI